MFIPTLCPACTAVVVVAVRDVLASRPHRCPCCGTGVIARSTDQPAPDPEELPRAA